MIKFNWLKVKGFKSFVEPTEIIIENGLTGIVGPNGCGKSNLVEAFRFVMGELSPKQMRGGELDDVIKEMIKVDKTVIVDVVVDKEENCFPMIQSGSAHNEMVLNKDQKQDKKSAEKGRVLV